MSQPSALPITFTVVANPRAKARPRMSRRHGKLRFYTPPKSVEFERAVQMAAAAAIAGAAPITGPVDVHVLIRLKPCASTRVVRANAMVEGKIVPAKAPDVDNIAKSVLDGCKGIAFVDDRQVLRLLAEKTYSLSAGVDVTITARPEMAG